MTVHKRITVEGMACDGCAERVHGAIEQVEGVEEVDVARHADAVEFVADDGCETDVHAAIFDAGYDVKG